VGRGAMSHWEGNTERKNRGSWIADYDYGVEGVARDEVVSSAMGTDGKTLREGKQG